VAANSKELVKALFASKPVSRPPFIPYMATAAAQLMQVPVRQMFSDPTTLANSLQTCQKLFKYDGIVILFDKTLEAEACGSQLTWQDSKPPQVSAPILTSEKELESLDASGIENRGRIPAVLEASKRLTKTAGREVAMLGVVTGPITLCRQLLGDASFSAADANSQTLRKLIDFSGKVALAMVRAYGELNFDAVIMADEDLASLRPDCYSGVQHVLKTIRNVLNFYDAPLIVQTGKAGTEGLQSLFQLEADGFSIGNPISEWPPTGERLAGACIPTAALLGADEDMERAVLGILSNGGNSALFLTSEGEVPAATPASNLHKVMQVLTATS
jgi:uroporphyrinogen-III decarboxylase